MSAITAHGWMWSARPAGRPARGLPWHRRSAVVASALQRHERVLAEAQLRDGGTAVGTDRALIVISAEGHVRRVGWADIAAAVWSPTSAATILSLWPDTTGRSTRIALLTDRRFASLAADRVSAALVLRRRVQLTTTVAATVLATRTAGVDGVAWRVVLDAGHENDREVASAARRAVAELRAAAGC
jgi:hypothetical protein